MPDLEDSSQENSSSDELSDEYVYTVNGASSSDTPSTTPQVDIKVQNIMIKFLIDSGATLNLIDEEAWSKILKRNKSIMLQKSTSCIYPYGSDKPLELKRSVHNHTIVSQPSKCLKFTTFREGCFVISNKMQVFK